MHGAHGAGLVAAAAALLLLLGQRRNNQKADARSIHDVPDDLLRLTLLRLDSPIWLIRAASACKRWRRVVTEGPDEGRAFLRLASSLHPPTVVGQYHNKFGPLHPPLTVVGHGQLYLCNKSSGDDIRFVLPSSSPIDGNRFSVDFLLDKNSCWYVLDCHGGLVLLCKSFPSCRPPWSSLVVYDPLTCQRRLICSPPPPHHEPFSYNDSLLLHGDDGNISISNFRVLHHLSVGASTRSTLAYVFSTANGGEWDYWRFLSRSADEDIFSYSYGNMVAGRAGDGSLYMVLMRTSGSGRRIITVDNTSLVLSRVNLPTTRVLDTASDTLSTFTIIHSPAGVLGPCSSPMTSIVHVSGEELELFRHVHGRDEWVLEHSIPNLLEAMRGLLVCLDKEDDVVWKSMARVVGHIADGGVSFAILSAYTIRWWFFSFDVNTMELCVLPQELYRDTWKTFNYTLPWPQFLRTCP